MTRWTARAGAANVRVSVHTSCTTTTEPLATMSSTTMSNVVRGLGGWAEGATPAAADAALSEKSDAVGNHPTIPGAHTSPAPWRSPAFVCRTHSASRWRTVATAAAESPAAQPNAGGDGADAGPGLAARGTLMVILRN